MNARPDYPWPVAALRRLWAGGLLLVLLLTAGVADATPTVTTVRAGEKDQTTRVVLDLSGPVAARRVFTLNNPDRVVLDLAPVAWQPHTVPRGVGAVRRVRFGRPDDQTARVVLDVSRPVAVAQSFMLPPRGGRPARVVLDLKETSRQAFNASVYRGQSQAAAPSHPTPASLTRPAPRPQVRPDRHRKPVVVIDAGHGGKDPGAIGVSGVQEKKLTLSAARTLRDKLNATGRYTVVLTRSDDTFIPLRQRSRIAHEAHADLFLSLHADAHSDRSIRGLSVYTVSEKASDREAAALARRENKADIIHGVDLSAQSEEVGSILLDLARRETMNLSSEFAELGVSELKRSARLLRNTHRFAGFMVLKSPDVPSVLVEMGYLSNPTEERLLRQPAYRAKLMTALVRAIDRYFAKTEKALRPQ